eukprot:765422-Hanusia_phi.AAC.4
MRDAPGEADGYWVRLENGARVGPLRREEVERRGGKWSRAWRTAGGAVYQVGMRNSWDITRLWKPRAAGASGEAVMLGIGLAALLWICWKIARIPVLRMEIEHEWKEEKFSTIVLFLLFLTSCLFGGWLLWQRMKLVAEETRQKVLSEV